VAVDLLRLYGYVDLKVAEEGVQCVVALTNAQSRRAIAEAGAVNGIVAPY
jgi:hypothetical protein